MTAPIYRCTGRQDGIRCAAVAIARIQNGGRLCREHLTRRIKTGTVTTTMLDFPAAPCHNATMPAGITRCAKD